VPPLAYYIYNDVLTNCKYLYQKVVDNFFLKQHSVSADPPAGQLRKLAPVLMKGEGTNGEWRAKSRKPTAVASWSGSPLPVDQCQMVAL